MPIYTKARSHFRRINLIPTNKLAVFCFLAIALQSCGLFSNPNVEIYLKNAVQGTTLDYVGVFLGPERSRTVNTSYGQTDKLILSPTLTSPRPLVVLYIINNKKYVWEALTIKPNQKYLIDINIQKENILSYRICRRPCDISQIKLIETRSAVDKSYKKK